MNKILYIIFILSVLVACKYNETKKTSKETTSTAITETRAYQEFDSLYRRGKTESVAVFSKRIKDSIYRGYNVKLAHKPVDIKFFGENEKCIVTFYSYKNEANPEGLVEGFLFRADDAQHYNNVKLDTFLPEGNKANIESVFTVNVDDDKDKELSILVSWPQRLKNMAVGTLYKVYFYDLTLRNNNKVIVEKLHDLNNSFPLEFEGQREGEISTALFKNAESIKKQLRKLGYL